MRVVSPRSQAWRDRVDVGAGRVHRRVHVGELALHQLELADRLAELLALVHVRQDDVEARRHDAERPAREHRALVVEAAHQHVDASAFLAQDVLGRTSQSSNTSSQVFEPRMPSLSSFCAVENPFMPFSIRNAVMPRGPACGSVFA